jgi:hypothetical protein
VQAAAEVWPGAAVTKPAKHAVHWVLLEPVLKVLSGQAVCGGAVSTLHSACACRAARG